MLICVSSERKVFVFFEPEDERMNEKEEEGAPRTKGLDFELLARAREEIARNKAAQEHGKSASSRSTGGQRIGVMAQRVVAALCGTEVPGEAGCAPSAFARGRVVFRYDFAQSDLPAMVVRGGGDAGGGAAAEAAARQAVADTVAAVYRRRQAEEEARVQREQQQQREREQQRQALREVCSEDDKIFPDAPCCVRRVPDVPEESGDAEDGGARRDYFESDAQRAPKAKREEEEEEEEGTRGLLADLTEDAAQEEDAEVVRLRAEVERLRALQEADEAQRAQDRLQDTRGTNEMDPAMRRYFAVCQTTHSPFTDIGTHDTDGSTTEKHGVRAVAGASAPEGALGGEAGAGGE